jgi:hypothetical protein
MARRILAAGIVALCAVCAACAPANTTAPTSPLSPFAAKPLEQYELTFAADSTCTSLPAAVRTRTYLTFYDPSGAGGSMGLIGGHFGSTSHYEFSTVYVSTKTGVTTLFFSDPEIWEQFPNANGNPPDAYLTIWGTASGTLGGATPWTFSGRFTYCAATEPDEYPECTVTEVTCASAKHTLLITKK